MKKNLFTKMAAVLTLTGIMAFSTGMTAMASTETASPAIERTRPWDGIEYTLGGIPESVTKIEYAGSVFYLGKDVTEADFLAVLAAGPEAVRMKPAVENGKLYEYPAYILWSSDKTTLLLHPIMFDYDNVLESVAIPANPPASLTDTPIASEAPVIELTAEQEYMLTAEYADAVRAEFYRLLNEHRTANGLSELEVNLELQDYADIRADEQRTNFGHTRPDGSYAWSGWHNSFNHMNSRYAENALKTGAISPDPADTALGMFTIWRESEGHNRHMLYEFDSRITMAFGIAPKLDSDGFVTSGAIFATGF